MVIRLFLAIILVLSSSCLYGATVRNVASCAKPGIERVLYLLERELANLIAEEAKPIPDPEAIAREDVLKAIDETESDLQELQNRGLISYERVKGGSEFSAALATHRYQDSAGQAFEAEDLDFFRITSVPDNPNRHDRGAGGFLEHRDAPDIFESLRDELEIDLVIDPSASFSGWGGYFRVSLFNRSLCLARAEEIKSVVEHERQHALFKRNVPYDRLQQLVNESQSYRDLDTDSLIRILEALIYESNEKINPELAALRSYPRQFFPKLIEVCRLGMPRDAADEILAVFAARLAVDPDDPNAERIIEAGTSYARRHIVTALINDRIRAWVLSIDLGQGRERSRSLMSPVQRGVFLAQISEIQGSPRANKQAIDAILGEFDLIRKEHPEFFIEPWVDIDRRLFLPERSGTPD